MSLAKMDLTPTERVVATLTCEGLSAKMIADRNRIAEATVHCHRRNFVRKMVAANIAEACYRFALWGKSFAVHQTEQNERKRYVGKRSVRTRKAGN